MPNYDELKKKAKDALETIADVSVEAYKLAEEKARVLAKRAKLNTDITRERASIRRAKFNIGSAYYDLRKDNPDDALRGLCNEITESLDVISAKQRELDELKKGFNTCDACDADVEDCECDCSSDDDQGNQ